MSSLIVNTKSSTYDICYILVVSSSTPLVNQPTKKNVIHIINNFFFPRSRLNNYRSFLGLDIFPVSDKYLSLQRVLSFTDSPSNKISIHIGWGKKKGIGKRGKENCTLCKGMFRLEIKEEKGREGKRKGTSFPCLGS